MNEARKCISRRLPPAQEFLNSAIALCRSFDVNFDTSRDQSTTDRHLTGNS